MTTLLLVEDDLDLAGNIIDYLSLEEYTCDHASNGVAALTFLSQNRYAVVILDINLPRLDGLSVCERIRAEGNDTPVIMLTARDRLDDKLAGFANGADDYLVKPFAMAELVARVQALSTRRSGQVRQLCCGPLQMDVKGGVLKLHDLPVKISPTARVILEQLMRAYPSPVSRDALSEAIWGEEVPDSNSLKVHIHNVRKGLGRECGVDVVALSKQGFKLVIEQE
ncbi:response regulator transcription factor [Alteromonas sp. C1M14]|uniref:response regulator transcription factor n=1 Tax=Alteromonas sp. C1M14 TaxID=2841567 RepID=UPI001C09E7B5|nr:response regulator transcription factor [Alteromonas sp. C1M14]MBU2978166.1 response regulator transcription factor [Alteromonas sp. C1M14]